MDRDGTLKEQNRRIADAMGAIRPRLTGFIRRRVAADDVEDVLQDVFSELVAAARLLTPIDELGAWLFRVARNRIIDRSRKQRPQQFPEVSDDGERWEDRLPSPAPGPDAAHAGNALLDAVANALAELPAEQRAVFVAHEIEGRSFKDIAAETGVSINTLLSRKRYALQALRRRLRDQYDEFLSV